jgi:hypothetical protein
MTCDYKAIFFIKKGEIINQWRPHKERGIHKSVETSSDAVAPIIENDIIKGYALPLPTEILFKVLNASLAPLGCICQDSINRQGLNISNFRMTHDHTFPRPSNLSMNLRVQKDALPPCMYSFFFMSSITLHCIYLQI